MKRICIFGAGAVGSQIAARAVLGGAEVSVVARGPHLATIKRSGLTLCFDDGDQTVRVSASDDPGAFGVQDVVIVTVKAPALADAARGLAPLLGRSTRVVFVQNGVPWWYPHVLGHPELASSLNLDPDNVILDSVSLERVIGAVLTSPAEVIMPGVVNVHGARHRLVLGRIDGLPDPDVMDLADRLDSPGFVAEACDDICTAVWDKLAGILMIGPMALLTQSTYRLLMSEAICRDAALEIGAEVVRIAGALGCRGDFDLDAKLEHVRYLPHRPSLLQDRLSGRAMEIDALLEAPRALARLAGVRTPTLDLVTVLARLAADDLHDLPVDEAAGAGDPAGAGRPG